MKVNDKKEIRTKTVEELRHALKDAQREIFTMRIDHSRQKLKNTKVLFTTRKHIAFLKTILKEKELAHANH